MNYHDLIKVLFALVSLQISEGELAEADKILLSNVARDVSAELPALRETLVQYIKGKEVDLTEVGVELKAVLNDMSRNPEVSQIEIALIRSFGLWFRVGSDAAFKRLARASVGMKMPWLAKLFIPKVGTQQPLRKSLEGLVFAVTKRKNSSTLTPEEAERLKAKAPEILKEYNRLRREFRTVANDAVSSFVRGSGKNLVPYQSVLKYLASKKIEHSFPEGFTGLVDATGVWFTTEGKRINGIPSGIMFPEVRMNPNPEGKDWVFVAIRPDGSRGNYFYTVETKISNQTGKFAVVQELMTKIDSIRKKWMANLANFDESDPKSPISAVLEMLYSYSARIGSGTGNAKGKQTFGIRTLLVKQCRWQGDGSLKIRYAGKDNVPTEHHIKPNSVANKRLLKAFDFLMSDKAPSEPVFTYRLRNGERRILTASTINQYFKSLGAGEATVHKLRTLAATKMMQEGLNELYRKKTSYTSPANFLKDLKKLATDVGKKLNHMRTTKEGGMKATPNTALQSYIDPGVLIDAFNRYQIPKPAWLERLVNKG